MTSWNDKYPIDVVAPQKSSKFWPIKLDNVYCDGVIRDKPIGVFTHFHKDHTKAIEDSVGDYDKIILHPITFAAVTAEKPGLRLRQQFKPHDFGERFESKFETIRLLDANHIPGSSQVHVEAGDESYLYSGDFNYPDLTIRPADYLVLDATHGSPYYDGKTDRKSVLNRMVEDVKKRIDSNKSVVIRSDAGTLQEIIWHFEVGYHGSKIPHDVPFVTIDTQKKILLAIYQDEKDQFRDMTVYDTPEFWKLVYNNKKCVIFVTNGTINSDIDRYYTIRVGQYMFTKEKAAIQEYDSVNKHGEKISGCRYNLASHASIQDILKYVEQVKPKLVVTDNSRSGYAYQLSKLITLKTGYESIPRPNKQ